MFKFLILQFAFSFSYSISEDPPAAPTPYPTTVRPTTPPTTTRFTTYPTTARPTTFPTTARPTTYPTTAPNPDGCPVGWVQSTEGCFLFHHTGITVMLKRRIKVRILLAIGLTWRQGQEECEKLGGYLAEIKSQMQQDFLES